MKGKIVKIILFFLVTAGLLSLFSFVAIERNSTECNQIQVKVLGDSTLHFITSDEVISLIAGDEELVGKQLRDMDFMEFERIVRQHPAIANADVYSTLSGTLCIDVTQREPLLRIIDLNDNSYYIDRTGVFMPLVESYTAYVPVATGYITDSFFKLGLTIDEITGNDSLASIAIADDLFNIASAISRDSFLTAQIEQMYVGADGEIELVPRVGPGSILLGDASDINDKLRRLKLFYLKGMKEHGWADYSALNLKYRNQIICTKNNQ